MSENKVNIENSIQDCISKELEKGIIEKVISEKLQECIGSAIKDMFSWNGALKNVIEEKVKSVMVPYLENYDYSEYILKLDSVLTEVLKNTALDNKKLLENFKDLMVPQKIEKIKVSEIFEKWKEHVAADVDTDDLEIDYDDRVKYSPVEVTLEVEHEEDRSWSSFKYAKIVFECEHDEKMNFELRIDRWQDRKEKTWGLSYHVSRDLNSLRYLSKFEIFIMQLAKSGTKIELDTEFENDDVTPDKEPEASFS